MIADGVGTAGRCRFFVCLTFPLEDRIVGIDMSAASVGQNEGKIVSVTFFLLIEEFPLPSVVAKTTEWSPLNSEGTIIGQKGGSVAILRYTDWIFVLRALTSMRNLYSH